ncbi:MAG TPA: tRNA 2-thiouridine(34) synthase MnmA [Acidimicrobiales bacterium]|nr:tRNA 2-thiouridine(34) synthase MnmA [Acidimicrobiales bacterium]
MARIIVAMSGGVDSSVAAALLLEEGHDVVGATMKLWGGRSDSGCCSVADVEDARRVAHQLGIDHHVFNFTDDFDAHVVAPYVAAHAAGKTPNPCVECNRHLKFDRFLARARQLGFDAVATGHHARIVREDDGRWGLRRGADVGKDQSYVLSMLGQDELSRVRLPVGELTKTEVRARAAATGLRTAGKPDSQDVCFILATDGGRATFLGDRIALHPGRVVDTSGRDIGAVDAVELVTVGQRRGLSAGGGERRFALSVDTASATVVVGTEGELAVTELSLVDETWTDRMPLAAGTRVMVQTSAHAVAVAATYEGDGRVALDAPQRRVAPGQTVAFYDEDDASVVGSGVAT